MRTILNKNVLLILSISVALFWTSCKKRDAVKPSGDFSFLQGKWKPVYVTSIWDFGGGSVVYGLNDSTSGYLSRQLEIDRKGVLKFNYKNDGYDLEQTGIFSQLNSIDSAAICTTFFNITDGTKVYGAVFEKLKPKTDTPLWPSKLMLVYSKGPVYNVPANLDYSKEKLYFRTRTYTGYYWEEVYVAYEKQ